MDRRQANLLDYETQARVIVQLADVRVVMLGVLRKPPYFAVNTHARELLHPRGVEKWSEPTRSNARSPPPLEPTQTLASPSLPSPASPVTLPDSVAPSPNTRRRYPLRASRTRSPSQERRRGDNNNLRLSRTLTHESTASTAESTSSASRGIIGRLRRWTSGSNDVVERRSQPSPGPSSPPPVADNEVVGSLSPSWVTSAVTPNTSMPHNSTPNPAVPPAAPLPHPPLPRLQHPEPSGDHAQYPNYTPGGGDARWQIEGGLEEGGLTWVGPLLILAQLVPHGMVNASTVENAGDVFSQGHFVPFRWDDLVAIAPWMEERLTRRDNGLTD
ncbi:hypothetical protein FRC09_004941 [Ceratobasidium sp. 395]|nr:hypothetical protein FRC09_004941 [Ceratobasidium sp. 395]